MQMNAIFGKGIRPESFQRTTFARLAKTQTFTGDITEVSGKGRFEVEVRRVTELGLDEGVLPDWAKRDSKNVMGLVYIAQTENKSPAWLLEQLTKLDSFKERFGGGIEILKKRGNLTTAQAIDGFLRFEATVKDALLDAGMSVNRASPEAINIMLQKGQSVEDVRFVFGAFQSMKGNQKAFAAFNEILAERGLEPLGRRDQLEFLEGKSSGQLYQIWEEASFNMAAQAAGVNISPREAMRLARRTLGFTDFATASRGMQQAASSMLRFRSEIDLDLYDIDAEDLIDISVGLAPRSGRSEAEVSRNMERAINQARAEMDNRNNPRAGAFRSFTPEGVPQAVSTSRSRTSS
jgi:hypothetical protein